MKLVTVYIPTRNRLDLLKRSLNSIILQSYKYLEIIVINDASSDHTAEYLKNLEAVEPRVKVVNNTTPKGACYSRNVAISLATGKYITGVDDDDYIHPDHIKILVENYRSKYSFVCSSSVFFNVHRFKKGITHKGIINLDSLLHYNKVGNQVLTETTKIRCIGGFDNNLPSFQDYDVWVRLVEKYGPCLKLKNRTYYVNDDLIDRISAKIERRIDGLRLFESKHAYLLSSKHKKSLLFLRKKINGEELSLFEHLELVNFGNYLSIIASLKAKILKNVSKCD